MKTVFWFFWSSENWVVGVTSRSRRTKPITKHRNVHCDWSILVLLLYSDNLIFTKLKEECEWWSCEQSWKKLEKLWFFWLWFRRTYHSAYDSELESYECLWPSENQKLDSVDSENQPLVESGVLGRGWYIAAIPPYSFLSWKFKMPH